MLCRRLGYPEALPTCRWAKILFDALWEPHYLLVVSASTRRNPIIARPGCLTQAGYALGTIPPLVLITVGPIHFRLAPPRLKPGGDSIDGSYGPAGPKSKHGLDDSGGGTSSVRSPGIRSMLTAALPHFLYLRNIPATAITQLTRFASL